MNEQALATRQDPDRRLANIQAVFGLQGASREQMEFFGEQCARMGLSPEAKQVYPMARRNNGQVESIAMIVSIDGLRVIAERSKSYRGQTAPEFCGTDGVWRDVWIESAPPAAARVGVKRDIFDEPIYGVARWAEFGGNGGTWRKYPTVMLAKCAEAQALRRAFPNDMSGLYIEGEIPSDDDAIDVTPHAVEEPPPASATQNLKGRLGIGQQPDDTQPPPEQGGDAPSDPQAHPPQAEEHAALLARWGALHMELDGVSRREAWDAICDHCDNHYRCAPKDVPVEALREWVKAGEQQLAEAAEKGESSPDTDADDASQETAEDAEEGLY